MEIYKEFGFESAHSLPNVPEGHKCARLHGHSFRVSVHVEGEIGDRSGWVCDFADITSVCEPVREELDHRYLNDIQGLENPTSEVIARWIWGRTHRRATGTVDDRGPRDLHLRLPLPGRVTLSARTRPRPGQAARASADVVVGISSR